MGIFKAILCQSFSGNRTSGANRALKTQSKRLEQSRKLKMKTTLSLLSILSLGLVAFVTAQQDTDITASNEISGVNNEISIPADAIAVSLDQDGILIGNVFQNVEDDRTPVNAKVTISTLKGEVLATSITGENGEFQFGEVEPGYYTVIGVGAGSFGDQVVNVVPHGEAYTTAVPVQVNAGVNAGVVYAGFQDAPLATFAQAPVAAHGFAAQGCSSCQQQSSCSSCSSCSGGCSGGGRGGLFGGRRGLFGGRGLGFGGGGLRSLLPFVGLAGLAGINGDDDDDASPTL